MRCGHCGSTDTTTEFVRLCARGDVDVMGVDIDCEYQVAEAIAEERAVDAAIERWQEARHARIEGVFDQVYV